MRVVTRQIMKKHGYDVRILVIQITIRMRRTPETAGQMTMIAHANVSRLKRSIAHVTACRARESLAFFGRNIRHRYRGVENDLRVLCQFVQLAHEPRDASLAAIRSVHRRGIIEGATRVITYAMNFTMLSDSRVRGPPLTSIFLLQHAFQINIHYERNSFLSRKIIERQSLIVLTGKNDCAIVQLLAVRAMRNQLLVRVKVMHAPTKEKIK